jgi:hypothetical protein
MSVTVILSALAILTMVIIGVYLYVSNNSEKKTNPILNVAEEYVTKEELNQIVNVLLNRIGVNDSEIVNLKSQIKTSNILDGIHGEQLKFNNANVGNMTHAFVTNRSTSN